MGLEGWAQEPSPPANERSHRGDQADPASASQCEAGDHLRVQDVYNLQPLHGTVGELGSQDDDFYLNGFVYLFV
jgi:hypothetical protein